jgi:adenylate cyclase
METPARILVVDDSAANRDLLAQRLRREGHVPTLAENGRQALTLLRAAAFDLVLLDIMMPEMNGYEVLERLRTQEPPPAVPVIVISALHELDSIVRCIELGAADYLLKPFNPVLLRARVNATLEKKRAWDREQAHLAQIRAEQEKSDRLLHSVFPRAVAQRLKAGADPLRPIAESFAEATILFADLHDFSRLTAGRSPCQIVELLGLVFGAFDRLAEERGVEKIKTIGDAYMAAAGLPEPRPDHAAAIADLALAMQQEIVRLPTGLRQPLSLRIGIHTGPVVAGVIGPRRPAYDLWGDTVNTAAQMESLGLAGCIQVTAATHQRLAGAYLFEPRGVFYVKGQGEVELHLLKGRRAR